MSMNDQGRSVTVRARSYALSVEVLVGVHVEAPRNRRCAVCACHPRRHCGVHILV